jgi:hypothetical protein
MDEAQNTAQGGKSKRQPQGGPRRLGPATPSPALVHTPLPWRRTFVPAAGGDDDVAQSYKSNRCRNLCYGRLTALGGKEAVASRGTGCGGTSLVAQSVVGFCAHRNRLGAASQTGCLKAAFLQYFSLARSIGQDWARTGRPPVAWSAGRRSQRCAACRSRPGLFPQVTT